jgi:branched-chain amino acid transport system permease protein
MVPRLLLAAIAVAALAVVPLIGSAYATSFIFIMLIAFVLAQSWDWIAGEMGYVNLGHFAFYGIGAYAFSIALVRGVPLPLCFAIAALFTAGLAAILALPLFRLRGDYFAFATLAIVPLAELLAFNMVPLTGGADGVVLPPRYVLTPAYYLAAGLCVITFGLTILLVRSRFGYALRSIRNDEQAAEVVGVRLFPVKLRVLSLSAGFAALAGAIQAWQLSYIDPPTVFGLSVALVPVAMALLGGSGLLWGPLIGVIILSSMQQWLLVNITILQATIYGCVILLIGRFMPGGLLRSRFVRAIPGLARFSHEHHHRIAHRADETTPRPESTGLPLTPIKVDRLKVLLEAKNLTMAFGGNVAVNDLSFVIREGEIVGLVGANGSGKTTLFNCISKVYEPKGSLIFDGRDLRPLRRDEVARSGVGRTHQIPRPFSDLTVEENIAIALMFRDDGLSLTAALAEAWRFAAFVGLVGRLNQRADALTLQEKKGLELARALALRPKLLLVDEVASGLTTTEVKRFVAHIREIRDTFGITVIWVEHIFSALEQAVDRLIVLEQGSIIADAPLAEAMRDEKVLKTYLGSAPATAA